MATITAPPLAVNRRTRAGETSPVRHVDVVLLVLPFVISGLGLLMIYSSTRTRLERQGIDPMHYVQRQGLAIVLGTIAMAFMILVDYRRFRDLWALIYFATLPLLGAVLVLGASRKGAQAWFDVGPLQFQPSEIAKVTVIIAVAGYCHLHRGDLDAWRLAIAVVMAAIPIGLVLMQNDLGSAAVIAVCAGAVLVVAGVRGQHALVLVLLGASAVGAVVATGTLDAYKIDRVASFINQDSTDQPAWEQSQAEYNLEQAQSAIATGGFSGSGLFNGTMTKNAFVPEQHTDFIFTVVGEEFGFVGGASVIALYALLLWRLWRIALLSSDFFGTLVTVGVLAMFAFQVFENIGMTLGIMPITGLPLPFMSYGGSAAIASFAAIGLAINVHMRRFS
jgi:rod shape determining protein RodA